VKAGEDAEVSGVFSIGASNPAKRLHTEVQGGAGCIECESENSLLTQSGAVGRVLQNFNAWMRGGEPGGVGHGQASEPLRELQSASALCRQGDWLIRRACELEER